MLEYDRIDISEGIDINKTNASKIVRYLSLLVFLKTLIMSPIFAMVVMI